ncbi:TRAP transporter large permease [Minwuia thermotolerans]|uniref:TRAP transporter large permease protein n=1 Tax=Minwuia thermotolerans TaxID=2056226 RepID=A0A2M9FX26_9PROT|nr:TRAP transporter large permease [Minwuia thermotolerans]PJK28018.1 C4-dicarboxylate ABC transporter [Minwuia thermotolerans]
MENEIIGLIGLGVLVVMLILRLPIGIALILVSFGGIYVLIGGRPAWGILSAVPYDFAAKWTLSSVPMFLLMGFVSYHAGLTKSLFDACRSWMARVPGGLAIASVVGSAGFAAVTGSSVACAAAMGRIAVPEMIAKRYDAALATGTIAAAGTLGALIPPSILLILFGVFAEVPIGKLFIGGVGAGLLTAFAYVMVIYVRTKLNPSLAPALDAPPPMKERLAHLAETWPIIAILVVVIGGIFVGFFTATEAGAIGAFAAIVISMLKRSLTREAFWNAIIETLTTTGALFLIAVGANLLTRFLALSGSGELIASSILGLEADPLLLILGISMLYLLLGMFLDPLGAMLLTLPVVLPVLERSHVDLIWFGVYLVKFLEIGMITPPIGLNVFVIKGVVGNLASLTTIFRGIMWFLMADAVVVTLLIAFPGIITYLPAMMQ